MSLRLLFCVRPIKSLPKFSTSRDLSIKYKSAKYVKFRRGECQSEICPYGYQKSADGRIPCSSHHSLTRRPLLWHAFTRRPHSTKLLC